jgi:hypothetical protein
MAGRDTRNGAANSDTVAEPAPSRSKIARRMGSETAVKVESRDGTFNHSVKCFRQPMQLFLKTFLILFLRSP